MGEKFAEVKEEHFTTITLEKLPHQIIEDATVKAGGGGKDGVRFKYAALKAAGWKYPELTSYGKDPVLATAAWNRIGSVLEQTEDKDQILESLSAISAG